MNKEEFYKAYGSKYTDEEMINYDDGIFKATYKMLQGIIGRLNKAQGESGFSVELSVINSLEFNAHALKTGDKEYLIALRSGVVAYMLNVIGQEADFFKGKYPFFEDIEAPIGIGCMIAWTQLFAHELGHILRGHLDLNKNESLSHMLETEGILSADGAAITHSSKSEETRFMKEFDADFFSSFFVAEIIHNLIAKSEKAYGMSKEQTIGLASSCIFFYFNYLAGFESKKFKKYPPAMVRANLINRGIAMYLSKKIELSSFEIDKVMNAALWDAYSFLDDYNAFNQDTSIEGLDELARLESKALDNYSDFVEFLSKNSSISYEHFSIFGDTKRESIFNIDIK